MLRRSLAVLALLATLAAACADSSDRQDQYFGTDAAVGYQGPEAGVTQDQDAGLESDATPALDSTPDTEPDGSTGNGELPDAAETADATAVDSGTLINPDAP